jgi:hypothetical protein
MNLSDFFAKLGDWVAYTCMPLVTCYHLITSNVFLNTAATDAEGLEQLGNTALIPFQYLFAGYNAHPSQPNHYEIKQHFDYHEHLLLKTGGSLIALPLSVFTGSILKGIAYLSPEVRKRHCQIAQSLTTPYIQSNENYYRSIGLQSHHNLPPEKISPRHFTRGPEDESHLKWEKEALREIAQILKENQITFWADCGTCLGIYRHGGAIPWDLDLDIGILSPDFTNVKHALSALDPEKYLVQDWSNRLHPETLLKVYVCKTREYIDIYHFGIDPQTQTISFILSNADSIFMPTSWKVREKRFTIPTPFETVFPLKVGDFDGIELPVPNQIERYLQMRYGDNLAPAKIYNEITHAYEKDLTHPYWQTAYIGKD